MYINSIDGHNLFFIIFRWPLFIMMYIKVIYILSQKTANKCELFYVGYMYIYFKYKLKMINKC